MASFITAGNATNGLQVSSDNTGILQLKTGTGSGTTAVTFDTGQRATFPSTISVGNTTPATTGAGITFPAAQSASSDANTLDDYEEGTWTPVWDSATGGSGRVTTNISSRYIKIGKLVYIFTHSQMGTLGTGGSGVWYISGLPFVVNGGSTYGALSVGYFDSLNGNINYITATAEVGSTQILLRGTTAAAATINNLTFSTYVKAGTILIISGCYEAAN